MICYDDYGIAEAYPAEAYSVDGYRGIAWYVRGWEIEERESDYFDPETDEYVCTDLIEERTGRIVATMVGDNRRFAFDPDEIHPLKRTAYCGTCGQIGCGHDSQ